VTSNLTAAILSAVSAMILTVMFTGSAARILRLPRAADSASVRAEIRVVP
jgi:hypothetical protein